MPPSGLLLTIGLAVETVRESAPVVHCLTPRAAAAFVADVLAAAGARPVLTGVTEQAMDATATADALLVDLGMLTEVGEDGVVPALRAASQRLQPWVLDASLLGRVPLHGPRLEDLLALNPTVVRALAADLDGVVLTNPHGALALATDVETVTAGPRTVQIAQGSERRHQIPGVRSAASALTAACAVVTDPFTAALAGAGWLALASERAASHAGGPASYRVALVDALASVRGDEIAEYLTLS